jgi:hypothetical protein
MNIMKTENFFIELLRKALGVAASPDCGRTGGPHRLNARADATSMPWIMYLIRLEKIRPAIPTRPEL